MIQYVRNFQKFRPLLGELVMRDVKIKYRKSVLGVLWTLLNPLLMMAVLSIVFSHLLRFNVENSCIHFKWSGNVQFFLGSYIKCNDFDFKQCAID